MKKIDNIDVIDVEAEMVEVRLHPEESSEVKSEVNYAHHAHYGNGVEVPELPQGFVPYQSTKAKTWLVVSSLVLAVVTVSVVQNMQHRLQNAVYTLPSFTNQSYESKKMAETVDMFSQNTLAFEQSMANFGKVIENKNALVKVETVIFKQQHDKSLKLSDEEARDLLLRAGYSPAQITDEQMASFKKRYQGVEGDVDFARDVAGNLVKEEVESFVHKAKIVSEVGEYIYNRINE